MPLADDVTVYPGHGAGSACGKNMMKETVDTLGNQKAMNYALRADMTRENSSPKSPMDCSRRLRTSRSTSSLTRKATNPLTTY